MRAQTLSWVKFVTSAIKILQIWSQDYDFCSCSIHYVNSSTDSVLFKPADLIHSNVDHRLLLVLYGFFYIVGILGC